MSASPLNGARDGDRAVRRVGSSLLVAALVAITVAFGLVARPAEASHNLYQVVDTGGADDAVGQADLTAFASDYTHLADGHIDLRWNWDVSSLSGANTGDACALHDTDDDTMVDGALCVTIGGNPATAQSVRQYLCSGGTADRCTNPTEIVTFASTCTVATAVGADPFNGSNDAQATCASVLADYGGNTHFTGVCSYPSREPNSNPSDCVMNPGTGLFIVKDAGGDTTTPFTFTVHDNVTGGDLILTATGADPAFAAIPNNDHSYTITESAQAGWEQTGATCTNGDTPPEVTLTPAHTTVTCTFTNAVHHDADMAITKADSADPVHEGEAFDYTLVATNNGPDQADDVTVTDELPVGTTFSSAVVTGGSGSCTGTTTVSCELGDLPDGASRTITIGVTVDPSAVPLPADLSNTATVSTTATDDVAENDSATEATTVAPTLSATKSADVTDVPEDGGDVTFTFSAVNHRSTDLTLTSFVDSVFGDLDGRGSCATPQTIPAGDTYSCTLTEPLAGDAGASHVDTVTAGATDAGGNEYSSTSPEVSIDFTDVASSIEVTKSADVDSVVEPGGPVTFTAVVENTSTVDEVTISDLVDSDFGAVGDDCTPALPALLAPGETLSCEFTRTIAGDLGDVHADTVTASGTDDDDDPVEATSNEVTVDLTDAGSDLQVTKSADVDSVPETGGDVTFTAVVENTSPADDVTVSSVVDSDFGDVSDSCAPALPALLAPGETLTCAFTRTIEGNAGDVHVDTVTVEGTDDDDVTVDDESDEVTIDVTDVASSLQVVKSTDVEEVVENGGPVTFTATAENTSAVDAVTVEAVTDDVFGDVADDCTPALPATLAPGETLTCAFTRTIEGNAGDTHVDTITVDGTDDDGQPVVGSDSASVAVTDAPSSLTVTKSADVVALTEPGGAVTFTAEVENTSAADDVTVSSLTDSDFGDVTDECEPALPIVLAPGDTLTCEFTRTITGDFGDVHVDTVTAVGTDDDAAEVAATSDEVTIDFTDAPSSLSVTKTADVGSVPEPGGPVTYTIVAENTSSADDVAVTSVVDDRFGELAFDTCAPELPTVLSPGNTITCELTGTVSGNAGQTHTNTVTVAGFDDDGADVRGEGSEDVEITDTPSSLAVVKTADVASVVDPGGAVTFTVTAENTSTVDQVTVSAVDDDVYGDVSDDCAPAVPAVLDPGEVLTCAFTREVLGDRGDTHVDTVTVTATDDDGNDVSGQDSETVDVVPDAPSSVVATKTADVASVAEPGGPVTFTAELENTSEVDTVTITGVDDDVYGDVADGCAPALPADLAPGEVLTCEFTRTVSGDAGDVHTDTVTFQGTDDDGDPVTAQASESVDVTDSGSSVVVTKVADVDSVAEPGGEVTFTATAENTSAADVVTIEAVDDDVYGDVSDGCTPALPAELAPGEVLTCELTRTVAGNAGAVHTDTITVQGTDDDGAEVTGQASESVDVTGLPSSVAVDKSTDVSSVTEPSGAVTFTATAENTSEVDDVTITEVTDDVFGDVSGACAPALPATLAPGETLSCEFTRTIAGDAGDVHVDTVTVTGTDDDGDPVGGDDSASVTVEDDLASSLSVDKVTDVASVTEAGGPVTFTATVENTSPVDDVTVDTVEDDVYGDLADDCSPALPVLLAPGDTLTCAFTRTVTGNAGDTHVDVITAAGTDDDGGAVSASDSASVDLTDVDASLSVTKTAGVDQVLAPGAPVPFTVTAENTSTTDDVTVESVSDLAGGETTDVSGACTLPVTLAPGETFTCTFTRTVTGEAGTTDTDIATVAGTDDDGNPVADEASETVDIVSAGDPDLTVTKTDFGVDLRPGATSTYGIDVSNVGPVPATATTHVVDELPAGLTLVETAGAGWDCSASTATVVRCDNDGDLAPAGSYAQLVLVVDVPAGLLEPVTNTAVVSNPEDPTDDEAAVTTDVTPLADLELEKTADTASATVGDQVTYTIDLANAGPSVARDVVVAERLPAGLALVTQDAGSGTYDPTTGDWTVPELGVGETTSLVLVVTVQPTGPYGNQAFVAAAGQRDPDSSVANEFGSGQEDDEAAVVIDVSAADQDPPPEVADRPQPQPDLPRTGSEPAGLVAVAIALLTTGGGVLLLSRRRPEPA